MVDQSLLAIINLTLINTKHQKLPVTNCSVQETCVWDLCMCFMHSLKWEFGCCFIVWRFLHDPWKTSRCGSLGIWWEHRHLLLQRQGSPWSLSPLALKTHRHGILSHRFKIPQFPKTTIFIHLTSEQPQHI